MEGVKVSRDWCGSFVRKEILETVFIWDVLFWIFCLLTPDESAVWRIWKQVNLGKSGVIMECHTSAKLLTILLHYDYLWFLKMHTSNLLLKYSTKNPDDQDFSFLLSQWSRDCCLNIWSIHEFMEKWNIVS